MLVAVIILLTLILSYVFWSLGLYTMARRRGVRYPGLAWVPVADHWLLGCLSDQYQTLVRGQRSSRRKVLPVLQVLMVALLVILLVCCFIFLFGMLIGVLEEIAEGVSGRHNDSRSQETAMAYGIAALVAAPPALCLQIWFLVLRFACLSDLFHSADPERAPLYLLLSIVWSMLGIGLVASVLVYVCREKEIGMPPRRNFPEIGIASGGEAWYNDTITN